ncbi:MAG: discoidin domain-containing protein [Acidobacteriota bacterium]
MDAAIHYDNLLDLSTGASVVSRTGEYSLDVSAAHAIDGMDFSAWTSIPGASDETFVFSLLSPVLVKSVGLTATAPDQLPDEVRFEGSLDGTHWHDLLTMKPKGVPERELAALATPRKARFIRIHAVTRQRYFLTVRAFHVIGDETAPPAPPPFTGCWTINDRRASITQTGARITGVIETDPPTFIDGGTDNRVAQVLWTQGPVWGYAALTRSNDGRHLTGLTFFEEIDDHFIGEGWFGEACSGPAPAASATPEVFLNRTGRYSLFGVVFDAQERVVEALSASALEAATTLLRHAPPGQRFRITSREFRFDTDELNARHTGARLTALRNALGARGVDTARLELVAAGNHWIGPPLNSPLQVLLASRIDIERVGR